MGQSRLLDPVQKLATLTSQRPAADEGDTISAVTGLGRAWRNALRPALSPLRDE